MRKFKQCPDCGCTVDENLIGHHSAADCLILKYAERHDDEIRRECAEEIQLLDKQRKEVHALVHKRPAPTTIVSMLCNMTERHTIELAKLSRAAILGKETEK